MSKKKPTPTAQPMQVDPKFLQEILQKQANKKNVIRLHKHPEQIKQSIKDLKEMSEETDIKNLFEDIEVLVNWALARLPLVKPEDVEEKKEEGQAEA